jgi:hypothetical protein
MAKRQWRHLDTATTYVFSPGNGWAFTMNADGTVSLAHKGAASLAAAVDMSIDPDPGGGDKYPPTGS